MFITAAAGAIGQRLIEGNIMCGRPYGIIMIHTMYVSNNSYVILSNSCIIYVAHVIRVTLTQAYDDMTTYKISATDDIRGGRAARRPT